MIVRIKEIESKGFVLETEILIIIAWLIFAFNYDNPDFENYRAMYEYGAVEIDSRIEIGYRTITALSRDIGLSFTAFRAVLAAVCFCVIKKTIEKYIQNTTLIIMSYMLYPFLFEAIQIRMFIVSVIIFFSIRYLKEANRKNVISFFACVLFAVSFQVSAVFFVFMAIAYVKSEKRVLIASLLITGAEIYIFNQSFIQTMISTLGFLGENFSLGMRYVTFDDSYGRLMWLYLLLDMITIFVVSILNHKYSSETALNEHKNNYTNILVKCLYISLITIPLMEIGSSWGRVFRSLLLVIYCAIVSCPLIYLKNDVNMLLKKIYLLAFSSVLFYSHILTGSNDTFTRVFCSMIENNYIYDLFVK